MQYDLSRIACKVPCEAVLVVVRTNVPVYPRSRVILRTGLAQHSIFFEGRDLYRLISAQLYSISWLFLSTALRLKLSSSR
jgi:hypothetical protein